MKIYLLYQIYCNGVESWETVFAVYADSDAANLEAIRRNEEAALTNSEYNEVSWVVSEEDLIE